MLTALGRTVALLIVLAGLAAPAAAQTAPQEVRVGTRVLRQAEEEAVRRGWHAARLDTASFRARGFYEKQG